MMNDISNSSNDPWVQALPPMSSWVLISQGAEARVWKVPTSIDNNINNNTTTTTTLSSSFVICKERFAKKYRHPLLDERLIKARVRAEVKALEKCFNSYNDNNETTTPSTSVRVPKVLRVDAPILYLEYLPGQSVRAYLEQLLEGYKGELLEGDNEELPPQVSNNDTDDNTNNKANDSATTTTTTTTTKLLLLDLAKNMGTTVAKLHLLGIIHGDLTTSNMMLLSQTPQQQEEESTTVMTTTLSFNDLFSSNMILALIDFGLAKNGTTSVEERAVDLYVLERALEATHPQVGDDFCTTVLTSYGQHMNESIKNNNNNNNNNNKSKDSSSHQHNSGDAILQRLEKVRQRGRKRECFG